MQNWGFSEIGASNDFIPATLKTSIHNISISAPAKMVNSAAILALFLNQS